MCQGNLKSGAQFLSYLQKAIFENKYRKNALFRW